MDVYDVFDFLVNAEFARWNLVVDELAAQEQIGYDGPRQKVIQIDLCLRPTVYTRS